MKSIYVIQEVKILPRVTANHRPGSETRWQEETNVRSRVDRVDRFCIELRNRTYFVVQDVRRQTDKGINTWATPELPGCEPRTVSTCWNATSEAAPMVSRQGGHRSRRPVTCRSRDDTGTRESLIVSCSSQGRIINGESSGGVHRHTKAPTRKASTARSIPTLNAENTGTTQRAGRRRSVGWTLGSLS
jgi:hypothetical protein